MSNAMSTGALETNATAHEVAPAHEAADCCSVLTIGHATRPIEAFVHLLHAHRVSRLIDVRTVPRSRHNPQFNAEALGKALVTAGIAYTHIPALGGFRRTSPHSLNAGWRNASFRGYADYMQTAEFRDCLSRLIELARKDRLALMCAEAVPWQCHRSLIADALIVHGVATCEIMSPTRLQPHRLTPFARVDGLGITYPLKR